MDKRTTSFLSAALLIVLGTLPASRAAAGDAEPPPVARPVIKKAPPATTSVAPANVDDAYRCHPNEDISCTVVRETAQGTLIVSVRPAGAAAAVPAWTVISGAPPTLGPHPGGTVYVVPNTVSPPETASWPHQAALMPANGAPILE